MNRFPDFLDQPAAEVAPRLLGCYIEREIDGVRLRGKIVEIEAYGQADPASHSYRGETSRTRVMFGESGCAYVYFTYGMHYCMNIVTGASGDGSAVLIRALEPISGIDAMRMNRPGRSDRDLMNGPAKLCQALEIGKQLSGHNLRDAPLRLIVGEPVGSAAIVQTTRIGISQAVDLPWRFYLRGNQFVSRQ